MSVDPKHLVNLQGKTYVLFPGLLDHAHQNGLVAIETDLLQKPAADNANTAIVKATATFKGEGGPTVWSAHGDASPANTRGPIQTALIRMAETRAVGRVLRLGTNVGVTMFEELSGGEDEEAKTRQPAPRQTPAVRHEAPAPPKAPQRLPAAPNGPAGRQAPAPMAAAPPGQQVAADEDPVLRCGWLKCGKPLSDADAATSMARFKHLVCPEHLPAAAEYFAKKQPVVIDIEPGADEGLIPTIAAQAQGF